jgi:hypothetical protein
MDFLGAISAMICLVLHDPVSQSVWSHLEVTLWGKSWSIQAVKILAVRFGDVAAC